MTAASRMRCSVSLNKFVFPAPDSGRDSRAKWRNIFGYLVFPFGTMIEVTGTCDGHHRDVRKMLFASHGRGSKADRSANGTNGAALQVPVGELGGMLKDTNGRVAGPQGAAARMGIKRTTLISRMKKLGIDPRSVVS